MLNTKLFFFISLLFFSITCSFFFLFQSNSDAKKKYKALLSPHTSPQMSPHIKNTLPKVSMGIAKQWREGLSKQILYQKEKKRMEIRISAVESQLVFSKQTGELKEIFKEMTAVMQEEITGNEQRIKHFNIEKGTYFYTNAEFTGEQAEIAHFLIPGDHIPEDFNPYHAIFKGHAKKLFLTLNKQPLFQTEGFKAIVN